jgi:hypothetical protein
MKNLYRAYPGTCFEIPNSAYEYMVTTGDNVVNLWTGELMPIYKFIKEYGLSDGYREHHYLVEDMETGEVILVCAYIPKDALKIAFEQLRWMNARIVDEYTELEAELSGLDEL